MRKPSVHVRSKWGQLYLDFSWQGTRCKEYLGILDTTENRKRCDRLARVMTDEMELGTFDYLRHFPNGSRTHIFTGKPDTKVTFERFAEDTWLPHIRTKVREATAQDYHSILKVSVFPWLGATALKDLRPEHTDRFINDLRAFRWHRSLPIGAQEIEGHPLSSRRINIILLRARQVLDLAFQRGYIEKDPHDWIALQEEELPEIDPLSFEERTKFLGALPPHWVSYFIVAFDTGMRPSEQIALQWPHIDLKTKTIFIRKGIVRGVETNLKTKKSRRDLDMLPTVEEALRKIPQEGTYVFPNADGGVLDLANIRNRIWYPTLKEADLRPRDFYTTRHTFASLMLQVGEDPAWIARTLGHTTTRMLYERYGKYIRNRTHQDGSAYVEALKRVGEQ